MGRMKMGKEEDEDGQDKDGQEEDERARDEDAQEEDEDTSSHRTDARQNPSSPNLSNAGMAGDLFEFSAHSPQKHNKSKRSAEEELLLPAAKAQRTRTSLPRC